MGKIQHDCCREMWAVAVLALLASPAWHAMAVTGLPDVAVYEAQRYERQGWACVVRFGPADACVDLLATSIRFDPTRASARYLLGSLHYQRGEGTEALAELANAYRLDASLTDALLMMGLIHLDQGRLTEAERKLRQFTALREDARAAYGLATVAVLKGDLPGAARWLRKALAAEPGLAASIETDPRWSGAREAPGIEAVLDAFSAGHGRP